MSDDEKKNTPIKLSQFPFKSLYRFRYKKKISFFGIRLFKPVKGQPKKQSKQKRTDKPIVIEDTRLNGPSLNNITHLGGGGSAKG